MSGAAGERIEVPGAVVERVLRPTRLDELTEVVSGFHARSEGILVCGGRTRLAQANRARALAAAVSLEALAGVDVFEPDEGVVHALAGTPIRSLQAVVGAEGWELPLDPPGAATTVGGAIASAATGPRAHAFGRVADAVLGLEVVAADGTPSKCGGRVVKNVTGYDLAKLYTGSFGSLAIVTGAWLRLRPQPASRCVLVGRVRRDAETFERARTLARATSVRAFVWCESRARVEAEVAVELGGSEAAVAVDRAAIEAGLALEGGADLADALASVDRLRDGRTQAASASPFGLRARVLATRLDGFRKSVVESGLDVAVDLGPGVVCVRAGERAPEASQVARLRAWAEEAGGHASFEWLPEAWRDELEVFGDPPATRSLAVLLKRRFDPRGILNPGRFVVGD